MLNARSEQMWRMWIAYSGLPMCKFFVVDTQNLYLETHIVLLHSQRFVSVVFIVSRLDPAVETEIATQDSKSPE